MKLLLIAALAYGTLAFTCTCDNGAAAAGGACTSNTAKCVAPCDTGYYLLSGACPENECAAGTVGSGIGANYASSAASADAKTKASEITGITCKANQGCGKATCAGTDAPKVVCSSGTSASKGTFTWTNCAANLCAAAAIPTGFTATGGAAGRTPTWLGTIGCASGYYKKGTPAVTCASANAALGWPATSAADNTCKACATIANKASGASVTCDSATSKIRLTGACDTGYWKEAGANDATADKCTACALGTADTNALTVTCNAADGTGAAISACKTGYYLKGFKAAAACTKNLAKIDAAQGVCTACAGDQPGCKTDAASKTAATCAGTGNNLECKAAMDGWELTTDAKVPTKCPGQGWTATWETTACKAKACKAGYAMTSATVFACTVENACTAGAAPTGYVAAGIVKVDKVDLLLPIVVCATASPATTAAVAGKAAVTAVVAVAAKLATKVAGVGAVTCASGYTASSPAAACPVKAVAFVYSGCKVTAPGAVAQTMIGFVLTIIAMYL